MKHLLCLLFTLSWTHASAQALQKVILPTGQFANLTESVKVCSDGGYIVSVHEYNQLPAVVKLDSLMQIQWAREVSYQLAAPTFDDIYEVGECIGGGYYVLGVVQDTVMMVQKTYLLKLDASGNLVWSRFYDGGYPYITPNLEQAPSGEFVINFCNSFNTYLMRTDVQGNMLWGRWIRADTTVMTGKHPSFDIVMNEDGSIVVTAKPDAYQYLVKLNATGQVVWANLYNEVNFNYIQSRSIIRTKNGDYVIAGVRDYTAYVMKVDAIGNVLWYKVYMHPAAINSSTDAIYFNQVLERSTGELVVYGTYLSNKPLMVTLDTAGNLISSVTIDSLGPGPYNTGASSMDIASNDDIVFTGTSMDSTGNALAFLFRSDLQANAGCDFWPFPIIVTTDTIANITHPVFIGNAGLQYTDSCTLNSITIGTVDYCPLVSIPEYTSIYDLDIYPNPFTTSATFEISGPVNYPVNLELYNSIGQQVRQEKVTVSRYELYKSGLSNGLYYFTINDKSGSTIKTGKVVIQ